MYNLFNSFSIHHEASSLVVFKSSFYVKINKQDQHKYSLSMTYNNNILHKNTNVA